MCQHLLKEKAQRGIEVNRQTALMIRWLIAFLIIFLLIMLLVFSLMARKTPVLN
ncbi:hypothetical protein EDD64_13030 [Effusibacillus lacus]|nr:hypothetical protein EDD64_13030 [Effusibacillus lacus]